MRAQAFLTLVGDMMTAQQDYYAARKGKRLDTYSLLVRAKELEKQVLAIVQEGRLEPDPVVKPVQASMFGRQCQIVREGVRCVNTGSRSLFVSNEHNEPTLISVCVECWKKL